MVGNLVRRTKLYDGLSIGQLAERTGSSVSAIRFYESKGLIQVRRNDGGQRRFIRSDIRRLSFILIMLRLGFTIRQVREQLSSLPEGRTPNKRDWAKISRKVRGDLDYRIATLTRLRERLDGCIGCGCLSLRKCAIYNPGDQAARLGVGPLFVDPGNSLH